MKQPEQQQLFSADDQPIEREDPWTPPEIGEVGVSAEGLDMARSLGLQLLTLWTRFEVALRELGVSEVRRLCVRNHDALLLLRGNVILLLRGAVTPYEAQGVAASLLEAWERLAKARRDFLATAAPGAGAAVVRRETELADRSIDQLTTLCEALTEGDPETTERHDLTPYHRQVIHEIRTRELRRRLPTSLRLRPLLRWLPLEWLDAVHARVCIDGTPRRPDREKQLASALTDPGPLEEILRMLDPEAREALRLLVDQGGVVPLETLHRRFGNDDDDLFPWLPEQPTSVLGTLRSWGLAYVGAWEDGGAWRPTAVVPLELRETVPTLLDAIDARPDPEALATRARRTARRWCEERLDGLPASPELRATAVDAVEEVAFLMFSLRGEQPEEWTEASLLACLVEDVPQQVTADAEWFEALPAYLAETLRHAGRTGAHPRGEQLAQGIGSNLPRILRAAKDPRRWGTAKAVAMAALAQGVDLSDPAARADFLSRWNRAHTPPQPARPPKVGRNEPCPCGSGRKYKRCCGS